MGVGKTQIEARSRVVRAGSKLGVMMGAEARGGSRERESIGRGRGIKLGRQGREKGDKGRSRRQGREMGDKRERWETKEEYWRQGREMGDKGGRWETSEEDGRQEKEMRDKGRRWKTIQEMTVAHVLFNSTWYRSLQHCLFVLFVLFWSS